jgi:hypothetical protein
MAGDLEPSHGERDARAVMRCRERETGYAKTGRLPSCCLPATPKQTPACLGFG